MSNRTQVVIGSPEVKTKQNKLAIWEQLYYHLGEIGKKTFYGPK